MRCQSLGVCHEPSLYGDADLLVRADLCALNVVVNQPMPETWFTNQGSPPPPNPDGRSQNVTVTKYGAYRRAGANLR